MLCLSFKRIPLSLPIVWLFLWSWTAQPVALGLPPANNSKTPPGHSDFVQFPDRTMGVLYTMQPGWSPRGTWPNGEFFCQAQGRVRVGPGLLWKFVPNMLLWEHTDVLSEFPPDTLQVLDLARMELNDDLLTKVGNLHSLRALSLDDTDITDEGLKKLANLSNLKHLDISKSAVKGPGLRYLTASKDLIQLHFDYADGVGTLLENLSQFPKLVELLLVHSRIKDSDLGSIAKVSNIEHLKLNSNNDVTNTGIKKLASLKHLHDLEIQDTGVTPAGLLALKGIPLTRVVVDGRYKSKSNLATLRHAFPGAEIIFSEPMRDADMAHQLFAPIH